MAAGLDAAATEAGIPHTVGHVGSMITLFFNPDPVHCWADADKCDRAAFGKYFWGLIDHGVYMPCSQFEALFFSRTHTEAMVDETVDAAKKVLRNLA